MPSKGTGLAILVLGAAALGIATSKKRRTPPGETPDIGEPPGGEPPSDTLPGVDDDAGGWDPAPHGGTELEDWGEPQDAALITQDTYEGTDYAATYRIYQGPQGGFWYAWRALDRSPEIFHGGPFANRDAVDTALFHEMRTVIGAKTTLGGVRN